MQPMQQVAARTAWYTQPIPTNIVGDICKDAPLLGACVEVGALHVGRMASYMK
jgi:hypothetical protein